MKHYTVPIAAEVYDAIATICDHQPHALPSLLIDEAKSSLVCQERLVQLARSYVSRGL